MSTLPNDEGLSEVIGFVLLLGVVVALLGMYMVYVVPINGREDEITQMNYVEEQFTDYKFTLDAIWTSQLINTNYANLQSNFGNTLSPAPSIIPATSTTTMKLGTGSITPQGGISLPLFQPIASSATLSIDNTTDTFTIDSSSYHSSPDNKGEFPINITSLEYCSNNNYWVQQCDSYEFGGVFLSQDNGNSTINRISPLISITQSANQSAVVNIVPLQIDGNGSYSGNGLVRVDTTQRTLPNYNISESAYVTNTWVNLSVTSANNATAAMWLQLFRDIAFREQVSSYIYGSAWNPASRSTTVFVNITGSNANPVSLYVQRAEFNVNLNSVASQFT
jgi:hypothetical protein